jgi:outer membrane lipoprotein-sorting protein
MRAPLALLLLLSAVPAYAAKPKPDPAAAEAYLSGIRSMKARFTQVDGMGNTLTGDFFLKRPGKMRFQYDPPVTDFIVADGLFIHYYDGQMKQASNAPIGQTLANFFLRKELSFSGELSISRVKRDAGLLQVTLVQKEDPAGGALTLFFGEKPMRLEKWRVVDAEGAVTDVNLTNIETGIDLDSDLFHYYPPASKKPRYN